MRTFRPLGPRVVATAFAKVSTPARRDARASTPNLSSCHGVLVSLKIRIFIAQESSAELFQGELNIPCVQISADGH
jgi:hypothetical protein